MSKLPKLSNNQKSPLFDAPKITNEDFLNEVDEVMNEEYRFANLKTFRPYNWKNRFNPLRQYQALVETEYDPEEEEIFVDHEFSYSETFEDDSQHGLKADFVHYAQKQEQFDSILDTLKTKFGLEGDANDADTLARDLIENDEENSIWGYVKQKHNLPNIQRIGFSVSPDVYRTATGYPEQYTHLGGWYDEHLIGASVRNNWVKNGKTVELAKARAPLFNPKQLYGPKVGNALAQNYFNGVRRHIKMSKSKGTATLFTVLMLCSVATIFTLKYIVVRSREEVIQFYKFNKRSKDLEFPRTKADVYETYKLRDHLSTYLAQLEDEE